MPASVNKLGKDATWRPLPPPIQVSYSNPEIHVPHDASGEKKPWWKRDLKDLISWPVAVGIVGVALVVLSVKIGVSEAFQSLAKRGAVLLALSLVCAGIVRLDQRFPRLKSIILILLLTSGAALLLGAWMFLE